MTSPIILFIDDDERIGIKTFHRLTNLGFVARFHRGPFGTLAAIRDTQCNLVLLDVNMPGLDGPAVVRVIRHTYRELPLVLFSNMEKSTLERLVRHVGVDGAIAKTATDEELVKAIHEALDTSQRCPSGRRQRSFA